MTNSSFWSHSKRLKKTPVEFRRVLYFERESESPFCILLVFDYYLIENVPTGIANLPSKAEESMLEKSDHSENFHRIISGSVNLRKNSNTTLRIFYLVG